MKLVSAFILTVLFLVSGLAYAQVGRTDFGKNRRQFKNFNWQFYSSENFNVYYYDGGQKLAEYTINYLEEEFDHVTDLLGAAPYIKTKLFLYNSVTDLQQSNVGIHDNVMDIGGKTDFAKSIVEIAYTGENTTFKQELIYKTSSMLVNEMMYGGSFTDMFQSAYLLHLPDWFIDGAARYAAYGWDSQMDDYIRSVLRKGEFKKLSHFSGEDAGLIGQSIWNYLAEKYGTTYISNILNLTRIIRNEEKSISGTLGVPYKTFIEEWMQYYEQQEKFVSENFKSPQAKPITKVRRKKNIKYNQTKISPNRNALAYTKNYRGKYSVYVVDLNKNRRKHVFGGGYKVLNQQVDYEFPLLRWKDERTLGLISARSGKNFLWLIDVKSGKKFKKELTNIDRVKDFDILSNGNLAVISAVSKGKNDLFLVSLRRNSIKRITNDIYDDLEPSFIPGTSSIVFSSNRDNDSINVNDKDLSDIGDYKNIFIYNIDTTKNTVFRLTHNLSNNYNPYPVNGREIYFLSDQQGIENLYKYNLNDNVFYQVSDFDRNLKDFSIADDKSKLAFVANKGRREAIWLLNDYELESNKFTKQTYRKQMQNAKFVAKRIKKRNFQQKNNPSDNEIKPKPKGEATNNILDKVVPHKDLPEGAIDTDNYEFAHTDEKESFLDAGDYKFDTDVVDKGSKNSSYLSVFRKLKKEKDIDGPLPYQPRFSTDNLVSSFVIDPLLGFGLKLGIQMNDELENNKFHGGALATSDLKSGELFGEYELLKYPVDFNIRYDRKGYFLETNSEQNYLQKYTLNKFTVGASFPFSITSRLSISPFYEYTNFYDLDPSGYLNPANNELHQSSYNYLGFKTEFVFDNSTESGLNLIQGTRGKISFTHHEGIKDSNKTFSNISVDFRNYQPISKEIVLATRAFYGHFFGNNPQKYMLGGMKNWFFSNRNTSGDDNPLNMRTFVDNSNILFSEFVTSLRGFDLNEFYGSNAMLFNAELRVPIVRYFYRGQISSNFLRNLMFTSFFDIGSAWSSGSPFSKENSVNTETLTFGGENPFVAQVQNFRNPWLYSYGFGLRTVLLGYFMKFDLAYPYNDYVRQKPKFYVTLGYDF